MCNLECYSHLLFRVFDEEMKTMLNAHTTFVTEVINHDYLSQVSSWGSFDDAVHRPHQGGPALIMEDNDHAGGEEVVIIVPVFTPADNINSYKTHSVLEVNVEVICACLVCITVHGFACEYTAYVLGVDSYTLACTSIQ